MVYYFHLLFLLPCLSFLGTPFVIESEARLFHSIHSHEIRMMKKDTSYPTPEIITNNHELRATEKGCYLFFHKMNTSPRSFLSFLPPFLSLLLRQRSENIFSSFGFSCHSSPLFPPLKRCFFYVTTTLTFRSGITTEM